MILNTQKNIIAQSQSGTGKTACFGLGMLVAVDVNLQETQALCLCPSLELAIQILDEIKKIAKFTKVTIEGAFRGDEHKQLIKSQIIIGTPGKVQDLFKKRLISSKFIKVFVLDEADEMLELENEYFLSN